MSSGSHPCGADDHFLSQGVLTLILEHNEPWSETGPTDALMERAGGFIACIAAGDAARYAPEAKSVRILIRYRDDPPPHEAQRAFEKFKEDARDHYGVQVVWQASG